MTFWNATAGIRNSEVWQSTSATGGTAEGHTYITAEIVVQIGNYDQNFKTYFDQIYKKQLLLDWQDKRGDWISVYFFWLIAQCRFGLFYALTDTYDKTGAFLACLWLNPSNFRKGFQTHNFLGTLTKFHYFCNRTKQFISFLEIST